MRLPNQIRRAHAAKMGGGPDGPTGLALAALYPGAEELAERVQEIDSEATEAEALEFGFHAREVALQVLEELLTGAKRTVEV